MVSATWRRPGRHHGGVDVSDKAIQAANDNLVRLQAEWAETERQDRNFAYGLLIGMVFMVVGFLLLVTYSQPMTVVTKPAIYATATPTAQP